MKEGTMARSSTDKAPDESVVEVDEITLDGKKVVVRNQDIPVEALYLDKKNPRIAHTVSLEFGPIASELDSAIEELLWSDPDVRDLYKQVLGNGGLIERIIVRPSHVVAEGNCRLVVYRKLHAKFKQDPRWQHVPARLLPEDIPEKVIALLLGQMHVTGKNEWTPFEKAGHVYKLHNEYTLTQGEIASRLRMSKSKVNQLIRAFEAMQTIYLEKYNAPGAIRKFSYFEELFKKPELREWAMRDEENVHRFANWVGTDKVSQGIHVRLLGKIVSKPDALAAFERNGFSEARQLLEEENPALSSPLFKAMVETTELLREARLDDIHRAGPHGNPAAQQMVLDLEEALARFVELSGRGSKPRVGAVELDKAQKRRAGTRR
jgi:hypothetical protein